MKIISIYYEDNDLIVEYDNGESWCYENAEINFEDTQDITPAIEGIISIEQLLFGIK